MRDGFSICVHGPSEPKLLRGFPICVSWNIVARLPPLGQTVSFDLIYTFLSEFNLGVVHFLTQFAYVLESSGIRLEPRSGVSIRSGCSEINTEKNNNNAILGSA